MQNVVQSSTTESVGNCSVKQHEVDLALANSSSHISTSTKKTTSANSVRKFNNNATRKALVACASGSVSQSTQVDLQRRESEAKRSKAQLMPSSSESDSDDVLSVESFFVEEEESEGGEGDDCHCPPSSASSTAPIDTTRFLLAAAAAVQSEGNLGELQPIDPNTKARIEALFEAAGIGKFTGVDSKGLGDSDLLNRLTSSVSSALDEAAAALTRMRAENSNIYSQEPRSLVDACNDGDVSAVRRLLDEGRSVHETTEEGESLLSLACSAGYYELAQVLLAMRANVEDRGVKGDCTPLMEAASAGNTDIVRLLLDHGADVNAQSSSGNTPLMYACAGGHEEVVKILIDAGANLEDHNENGHTPLMEAASAGHVGVAKILLQCGAGINTHSNEFKESALTLACYKGHLEMVRFLLEAGADQEHKTDEMHTALMEASMDGHVEVARLLLNSGAQVNMPADSFESPLTLAACGGHVELAMLLLERGANIEEVNDEGYTPLMEAAREGHEEMVALLLNQDAEINAQTEETQETALTLACCGGFIEVADLLIKAGADIELGASTPLMEAAQEGHVDLVRYLLEAGANVNAQTATGDTALTYACENGHTQVAEVLLHWGADLEHASEGGRTPLMKAARAGHLCTVQFLIAKGADVNRTTTHNDHTPLSLACAGGHLNVAEVLLLHGANPFHRLKDNSTMIIEAAKSGHTRIVELLLDYPNSLLVSSDPQSLVGGGLVAGVSALPSGDDVVSGVGAADSTARISPTTVSHPAMPRPEPQGAATTSSPAASAHGVAGVQPSVPSVSQKAAAKKSRTGETVSPPSDQPLPSSQPLTIAEVQQTKNPPTGEEDDDNWVSGDSRCHKPFFEKTPLFEELENIERELRGEKTDKSQATQTSSTSPLQTQTSHPSPLSAALSHMLTEVAELNRSNPGSSVGGVVATTMPVKLEDIVKMLGELPFEAEPTRTASPSNVSSTQPVVSVPLPAPSQSRESVIVTNPNAMSSTTPSAAVAAAAASLPPSERPKVKAVSKKDSKNVKKLPMPQQQLETSFQQYPQMQQLQHLQQLNQHLQQQLMQQRQLKQQNQAKLAVLQQNALHNQVQLAALQRNVAQLQQLEQQVLGPAYGAALEAGQGASAAAARAEFQNCVQQILRQKQQLQQQIRQFQMQVEQQLNQPQEQQQFSAASVTSFDRIDTELTSDQTSPVYKSPFYTDDSKAEEIKPHNRCEKRPIDRTLTDDSSSTGLHVTGAPVPLYAAHDAAFAAATVGVQIQNTSSQLSVMNGTAPQPGSAVPFPSLNLTSTSLSSSAFTSTQVATGPFQLPYPGGQPALLSDRQMQPLQPPNLNFRQQVSLQAHPSTQSDAAESRLAAASSSEMPMAGSGVPQQQNAIAAATDKKPKNGKKPKPATTPQQQLQTSYPSQLIENTGTVAQQPVDSAPIYLASSADFLCHVGSNGSGLGHFSTNPLPFSLPPSLSLPQVASGDDGQTAATAVAVMGDPYTGYITDFVSGTGTPASLQHQSMATAASVGLAAGIGASPYVTDITDYSSLGYLPNSLSTNGTVVPGGSGVVSPYGVPAPGAGPVGSAGPLQPPAASSSGTAGQYLPMLDLDSETDSNHDTALTLACTGGHEELVELLVERGADIEHRDKKGFTPLILAATAGHEKVVEALLNRGANIEAHSERTKDTALSLACSGGRYEVVELLLIRGANKEHRNVSDYTPLSLAASGGYVNIIKLLLAHGAEINSRTGSKLGISPLMLAAMNGHVAAVRTLLEMGSDINAQIETNRNTALTLACFQGRHEVVQLLLEKKANVEHRAKTGLTPLMEAASGGYVEVGRVLLDYNADVNAPPVPSSRDTALTIAADKGHVEFVDLLLSRGAQPDVKNKKGNSPLWLAANGGHLEVIELLYRAGADIDSQDNRKVSCLMAAFRKGHVKVVKWMVKKVTQFPSDNEMTRYLSTVVDKDVIKKCHHCMEIIRQAKDHQAAEANKNAANLLDELDMEKIREDLKRAAAARKRERKKRKKQEKREEKKKITGDEYGRDVNGDEDKDDDDDDAQSDSELGAQDQEISESVVEPAKVAATVEKVAAASQAKSSKKRKNKTNEMKKENLTNETSNQKDDTAEARLSAAELIIAEPSAVPAAAVASSKSTKSEKTSEKTSKNSANKKESQEGFTLADTLKDASSIPAALKSPTSVTSPKKPQKREEGWKEVVRRGPVSSRDTGVTSTATALATAKKSSSSDRSTATLSVLQSSERSKKVSVPSNAISRVIGRAGCNINAIREISGAHIEIEKQGKGQGDRSVLIKGSAESIRQAQQLIAALIKEPEKEFNELMAKFRAANAAAAAVPPSVQPKAAATKTSAVPTSSSASVVATQQPQQQQPKVTRAATTIISTKPVQGASAQSSAASTASAWGTASATAHPSPKRSVSVSGTKTPPVTAQQQILPQQPKGQAVRQLFPADSSPPAPPSNAAASNVSSTTTTQASRTTPIMSTTIQPRQTSDSPGGQQPFAVRVGEVKKPVASHPPAARPSSETSLLQENTSPVQEYSPFNNQFSKYHPTMWSKDAGKMGRGMNFASAAAAGIISSSSRLPTSMSMLTSVAPVEPQQPQVDLSKAPGYRGNMGSSASHHGDMSGVDVPTSLTSSAPGTPIPSGFSRLQGGSRPNPLTPPPRIGSPVPLFNPTLVPPSESIKRDCNSPTAFPVPPPSPLAPGGPTIVRTGGHGPVFSVAGGVNASVTGENPFDGMNYPGFRGLPQPGGGMRSTGPSFPLAPGVGGPRFGGPSMPPLQSKLNPNAPDFSSRGMGPSPPFQHMFGGRMSMPTAGFPGMQPHVFNADFPPPIGAPFPNSEIQRMLGFPPGPLPVNPRVTIPPPPAQNIMNQGGNSSPLVSPVTSTDSASTGNQTDTFSQHVPPSEDVNRKALRPIGTERAQQRRPPAPAQMAANFGNPDLGLWAFGGSSTDLGASGNPFPAGLPPTVNADWLMGPMAGLHASVAAGSGVPNSVDESGLLFMQKQGLPHPGHHHLLQRQLEGIAERPGDLELAFSQNSCNVNGAPGATPFHNSGFMNGMPPPVLPSMYQPGAAETSGEGDMANGIWMGPGAPIGLQKNKNAPIGTGSEQSLAESSLGWGKWA